MQPNATSLSLKSKVSVASEMLFSFASPEELDSVISQLSDVQKVCLREMLDANSPLKTKRIMLLVHLRLREALREKCLYNRIYPGRDPPLTQYIEKILDIRNMKTSEEQSKAVEKFPLPSFRVISKALNFLAEKKKGKASLIFSKDNFWYLNQEFCSTWLTRKNQLQKEINELKRQNNIATVEAAKTKPRYGIFPTSINPEHSSYSHSLLFFYGLEM